MLLKDAASSRLLCCASAEVNFDQGARSHNIATSNKWRIRANETERNENLVRPEYVYHCGQGRKGMCMRMQTGCVARQEVPHSADEALVGKLQHGSGGYILANTFCDVGLHIVKYCSMRAHVQRPSRPETSNQLKLSEAFCLQERSLLRSVFHPLSEASMLFSGQVHRLSKLLSCRGVRDAFSSFVQHALVGMQIDGEIIQREHD